VEDELKRIIESYNEKIAILTDEINKLQTDLLLMNNAYSITNAFIKEYELSHRFNFGILQDCKQYLIDQKIIDDINYKKLQFIKEELEVNFPEKVSGINDNFEKLEHNLRIFLRDYPKKYKLIIKEKTNIEYKIQKYQGILDIINKLLNGEIFSEDIYDVIDNMQGIEPEDKEEIYHYITIKGFEIIASLISDEKKKQNELTKKKIIIESRKNNNRHQTRTINPEILAVPVNKPLEHSTSETELKLLNQAQKIINENNVEDTSFIKTLIGLNCMEMLEYIDVFKAPEQKLAIILKEKVIPLLERGKLENSEMVLKSYISKYNLIKELNTPEKKLENIGKSYMLQTITLAQEIIKNYENNQNNVNLAGYYSCLKTALDDMYEAIKSNEICNSYYLDEIWESLKKAVSDMSAALENGSMTGYEDDKVLYNGANNIIVFMDGIDLSKQIDDNKTLNSSHKKKVLNGLENMINDANILTSSNHHVKDTTKKYDCLRRYKAHDYRLVYRVSSAAGLSKIYGRPMNVIYPIMVFYGATDDKKDDYKKSKQIYDSVSQDIERNITIMNSNDYKKISQIVKEQAIKMKKFIESTGKNMNYELGGMGGK